MKPYMTESEWTLLTDPRENAIAVTAYLIFAVTMFFLSGGNASWIADE